jgi:hypothetical protein
MWLAILAISGCGHGMAWKESVSLAPDKIAGRQLEYTDSHGVNIYTFFKPQDCAELTGTVILNYHCKWST